MALNKKALETSGTPEFWMQYMARLLLDRNRNLRLAVLHAHLAGTPPMLNLAPGDRGGWYKFQQLGRVNMALKVMRAKRDRMKIRAIRTAASTDDRGDEIAWKYWMRSGLPVQSKLVHTDQLALNEGYVRVSLASDGVTPLALRRDPRYCISIDDPLDPLRPLAGFELLWDEVTRDQWAFLWIRGSLEEGGPSTGLQYVARAPNQGRPRAFSVPGITTRDAMECGWWWPRLSFDPGSLTMRPFLDDVDKADRDSGPYSQVLAADVVPLFRFPNRDNCGEYERALPTLGRINRTTSDKIILQAIQAYKQRALEQEVPANGAAVDRLPPKDKDGKDIAWDEVFAPGPDALWKLPPGVKIWESKEINLDGIINSQVAEFKVLATETDTPLPAVYDTTNESADSAQYKREANIFGVEDCATIAGGQWAQVVACMFLFAPDSDRYAGTGVQGKAKIDRADPGSIRIDWAPVERHSLAEKADADSKNKTLSMDDAARIIWELPPEDVAANRARRKADQDELPMLLRMSQLPPGLSDNQPEPAPMPGGPTPPKKEPAAK